MKQEFTPPMFKAKRTDGNGWFEGMPVWGKVKNTLRIYKYIDVYDNIGANYIEAVAPYRNVNPSTLCMDSGLTAEWVADGIDKKIWSGDLFQAETVAGRMKKWEVTYENGAFWAVMGEQKELLFNFLSSFVYIKIGSIHENEGK